MLSHIQEPMLLPLLHFFCNHNDDEMSTKGILDSFLLSCVCHCSDLLTAVDSRLYLRPAVGLLLGWNTMNEQVCDELNSRPESKVYFKSFEAVVFS